MVRRTLAVLFTSLLLSAPLSAQVRRGGAVKADGSESGSGSGTVTTTGTLASGQVALGSGATSITGDAGCTWTGTGASFVLATTSIQVNGLLDVRGNYLRLLGVGGSGAYYANDGVTENVNNGFKIAWSGNGTYYGAKDLALSRASAGLLLVEDGTGNARDVQARTVLAGDGTVGAPSVTFASETDFGFYRIGAGNIGLAVSGSRTHVITSSIFALESTVLSGWFAPGFASFDAPWGRQAAATFRFGSVDSASPVSQTLQAQGARAGTDTNVAGGNLTIRPGAGTGSATGSSIVFQTPTATGSGTTGQTQTTRMSITEGHFNVAALPVYANNAAALAGNLVAGDLYRTNADPDPVCVVH